MYAQLVPCSSSRSRRSELERLVTEHLIPALRREPDFAGALNLVDPATGGLLVIVLWEAAEQARRPLSESGRDVANAFARVVALADGACRPASLWDVDARV